MMIPGGEDISKGNLPEEVHNLNISSYRLLYLFLLLCQSQQLSFEDLNTHLLNNPLVGRTFTHETLGKYMNTLRMFGCTVSRFETQSYFIFRLEEHPFKLELTPEEHRAVQCMGDLLVNQPLGGVYKNFYALVKRFCYMTHIDESNPLVSLSVDLESRLSNAMLVMVQHFQRYCAEGQVLELAYQATLEQPAELILVEPYDLVCHRRTIYLMGYDPKTNRKVRYELDRIKAHRQLPSRVRMQTVKTTVTFKLTGRVALNYLPYPGETVLDKGEFLLVKYKTDDLEQLLRRLLKYGTNCQVLSPESARKEMLQFIEHLLDVSEKSRADAALSKAQTGETRHKWACYLDSLRTLDDVGDG